MNTRPNHETRVEHSRRVQIEANHGGGWTIWIWTQTGSNLMAYREVSCEAQIDGALTEMHSALDASPKCEHGAPARHVLLTDKASRSDADPYGDIEGPEAIEHLASMERTLAAYSGGGDRYTLSFVHSDMCRTER